MPLSDVVNVLISLETAAVTAAGFGVPLILGAHTHYSDRIRFYTSLAEMETDGFTSTEPEYKAAAAIAAQNPRPERWAVGRRDNRPTQHFTITPTVLNSTAYKASVNGTEATFTSDATATAAEIVAGLKTAIDALAVAGLTTATTATTLTLTGAAGAWFNVSNPDPSKLSVVQDGAANDPATDLSAISQVDDTWYAIVSVFNSKAEVLAIADWAETHGKLYVAQTQDTDALTTTFAPGATDIGSTLKNAGYARTALIYSPNTGDFADAAWAGRVLPLDAGSETWKFKALNGVTAANLTATQINVLRSKSANWYYSLGGRGVTAEGTVAAGEFIDVIRGRDWMQARLQERVFRVLSTASTKVPYTDAGIATIEAEVRAQLQDGIDVGFLADDPAPTVQVPKASAVASNDKAARLLPDVKFFATIAGAIHKLNISGTISV